MKLAGLKKLTILLVTVSLVSNMLIFTPSQVKAAVPTFETNPAVVGVLPHDIFEFSFALAMEALKRQILNMIVDQITDWIQGGGKPRFITDWSGFLRDAADQAAGAYLNSITDGQFCSALNAQILFNAIPVARFGGPQNACTLGLQGRNLEDFFNNFTDGGWVSWIQLTTEPQNNIFGQYALNYEQYIRQVTAAQQAALAEAQAGRGFIGVRKCVQYEEDELGNSTGNCIRETIVTPGSVVGDLATKAIGSDIDYIVNADDLKAYVSAITNAVLNRLFSEGLSLLRSSVSPAPSGRTPTSPSNTANACAGLSGTPAYNDCLSAIQGGQDLTTFQKGFVTAYFQRLIDLKYQILAAKQNTSNVLNQTGDVLNQLRTCLTARRLTFNQQGDIDRINGIKNSISSQITTLTNEITRLTNQLNAVENTQDTSQFVAIFRDLSSNPQIDDTDLRMAQNETSQKQTEFLFFQNQLQTCQGATSSGEGGQ